MAEKKFFVDVNLQGNNINNLKADTLDITTNLASANTKRIVYWSSQYYYSDGTSWIALGGSGNLPAGGATGDILAKASGTDYDVEWISNYTSTVQHEVKAGVALTKGQAVYVSSANGTNMIVSKASNASESTSSKTMGLVASSAALNDIIFVITEGLLTGTGGAPLDTSTATEGDPVWLGTNGNLIFGLANKPVAPAHLVFLGIVTRVSSTVGEIFVKVQNGFELGELHDVDALNASNNDGLFYNTTTSLWEHKSIATALGYTPENQANKSTSTSLGTSDTLYPTQNAVKVYADSLLGNANALVYKGTIDCSTNPDYPAADAGWMYIASVAGKIGGASGTDVEVGDMIICNTDGTVSGDQATVGQYWNVIQKNIVGAVTGPASSINNTLPVFDGTTGKIVKQGIITDTGSRIGVDITSPTAKLHISNLTTDDSFLVEDNTNPDSTPFIINNAGNVGIGILTPTAKLQVKSTAIPSSQEELARFEVSDDTSSYLRVFNGTTLNSTYVPAIEGKNSSGYVGLYMVGIGTTDTGTTPVTLFDSRLPSTAVVTRPLFQWNNYGTAQMIMGANGNLGIGTSTISEKLNVFGNIYASSSTTTKINIESGAGVRTYLAADGQGSSFGSLSNHDVIFYRSNSEFARKTATGFGIGTATPGATLEVNGNVKISTIANAIIDTDKFLVSDSGVIKYRTGTEVLSDIGAVSGSGTANFISKFTASGTIGNSIIQDNGAQVGINTAPIAGSALVVSAGANSAVTTTASAPAKNAIYGSNIGDSAGNRAAAFFESYPSDTPTVTNIYVAGRFYADGPFAYAVQLQDNSEGIGKFLKCITSAGQANWATMSVADTGLTVTTTGSSGAATLVGNTLNIPTYESSLIPKLEGNEIWRGSTYRNNSTTVDTTSGLTVTPTGTPTARAVATTSYATRSIRLGITASVTATGRYSGVRGSALLWYVTGGFLYTGEFNISDTATAVGTHNFWGLASSTSDLLIGGVGNSQPSALTNIIAFANDSGDTNLQIMHNDATDTATKTDLGSSFPANRTAGAAITTIYSCYLYNAPASSNVIYRIVNKETGAVAQGTLSTNLPASTVGLNFFGARTMGTSGGGINNSGQFDVYRLGVYSL
jgi:hypothetical protein